MVVYYVVDLYNDVTHTFQMNIFVLPTLIFFYPNLFSFTHIYIFF